MDDLEVVGCVAAVVATYGEGCRILQSLRERSRANGVAPCEDTRVAEIDRLEESLNIGRIVVQDEYDQIFELIGRSFATGDREFCVSKHTCLFNLRSLAFLQIQYNQSWNSHPVSIDRPTSRSIV